MKNSDSVIYEMLRYKQTYLAFQALAVPLIIALSSHTTIAVCHETSKCKLCAGSFFICFLFVVYIAVLAIGFTGLPLGFSGCQVAC